MSRSSDANPVLFGATRRYPRARLLRQVEEVRPVEALLRRSRLPRTCAPALTSQRCTSEPFTPRRAPPPAAFARSISRRYFPTASVRVIANSTRRPAAIARSSPPSGPVIRTPASPSSRLEPEADPVLVAPPRDEELEAHRLSFADGALEAPAVRHVEAVLDERVVPPLRLRGERIRRLRHRARPAAAARREEDERRERGLPGPRLVRLRLVEDVLVLRVAQDERALPVLVRDDELEARRSSGRS